MKQEVIQVHPHQLHFLPPAVFSEHITAIELSYACKKNIVGILKNRAVETLTWAQRDGSSVFYIFIVLYMNSSRQIVIKNQTLFWKPFNSMRNTGKKITIMFFHIVYSSPCITRSVFTFTSLWEYASVLY